MLCENAFGTAVCCGCGEKIEAGDVRVTRRALLRDVAEMLPGEVWRSISPELYLTFWSLSPYDLESPTARYESETERFNAEDAFHECYVCGVYAGGDAIQLECSHLRPSFAQAYSCTDRAGCVARAEERVRVAQAELEFAQGRVAFARERISE